MGRFLIGFGLIFSLSACALSPLIKSQVDQDWLLASTIRGAHASPLHRKIFGGNLLDGSYYRAFFETRVKVIEGEGFGFASCHGAFACSSGSEKIRISKKYVDNGIPSIVRLSILIHESRHAEGVKHVSCPDPLLDLQGKVFLTPYQRSSLNGLMACDDQYLGAIGTQIVMLRNVARFCDRCRQQMRDDAGSFANSLMNLILSERARRELTQDAVN